MTSRREFLHAGLTGAVALGVSCVAWSTTHLITDEPLYAVIFDDRFPASAVLARQLAGARTPMRGIRGDVTSLWYHDLFFQWKKGPSRIAGVTTSESLFCLEMLGRDSGLSVRARENIDNGLVLWSLGPRVTARR